MEVQYKCDLRDYKEALLARKPRQLHRQMLWFVVAGLIGVSGFAILTNLGIHQGPAFLVVATAPLAVVLLCRSVMPVWISKDFRKNPNFSRETHLLIDEEGVHSRNEIGQGHKKWIAYSRYRETANLFLLYLGARSFEAIPKRAFANSELDEFRQLLRRKLPSVKATP